MIELGLIVSIMLGDQPEPTLLRDTIHAVVVLVLHGVAGLCIVVGALRHREQEFRVQGAQAYLIVLLPMVVITLVLPNFTTGAPGPYYTNVQLAFVGVTCLLLWLAFSFVQTVRHREHFLPRQTAATAAPAVARRISPSPPTSPADPPSTADSAPRHPRERTRRSAACCCNARAAARRPA